MVLVIAQSRGKRYSENNASLSTGVSAKCCHIVKSAVSPLCISVTLFYVTAETRLRLYYVEFFLFDLLVAIQMGCVCDRHNIIIAVMNDWHKTWNSVIVVFDGTCSTINWIPAFTSFKLSYMALFETWNYLKSIENSQKITYLRVEK